MANDAVLVSTAPADVNEEVRKTFGVVMTSLATAAPARGLVFFPNGIELIYVKIELKVTDEVTIGAEIKIAGPKPPSLEAVSVISATEPPA